MSSLELTGKTTHIGSLPFTDLSMALDVAFKFDVPAWPQLPKFKSEGMLIQFCEGLPGFNPETERIDYSNPRFEDSLLKIYDDYHQALTSGEGSFLERYIPSENSARLLRPFIARAKNSDVPLIKGQVTGPFTLATALKDPDGQSIIFIPDLRDMLVKFVTIKALSQAKLLATTGKKVLMFLDEPGLAGFGSSGYLTITKDEVVTMLGEVISALTRFAILTGVHVCANTSWDLVFEANPDIISFDSFTYFDKFLLYGQPLQTYLKERQGFIAWGCVPTDQKTLESVTIEDVKSRVETGLSILSMHLSLPMDDLIKQSLFTPACGLGSLPEEMVHTVIEYLRKVQSFILNLS